MKGKALIICEGEKGLKHPIEIEINFSNVCAAECIICSRPHGYGNKFFMEDEVFNALIKQMEDIKVNMIQTSGNGEAFLNPKYLDYVSALRGTFFGAQMWTYNNFSMLNQERARWIIAENLFDKIHVRIDSLEKWVFERNSNLNQETVFENLKYFLSENKKIPVTILYNNINDYYDRCKKVLGKHPARNYFSDNELSGIQNEAKEIKNYFQPYSKVPLTVCTIGHSLWGERRNAPRDTKATCPKWNVINNVTWVCPNGDVNVCCYDDTQSIFKCGNILEDHLLRIFNGGKRKEILESIRTRRHTDYPCTNPNCCRMGDEEVEKK